VIARLRKRLFGAAAKMISALVVSMVALSGVAPVPIKESPAFGRIAAEVVNTPALRQNVVSLP
jgi:hypothetical protein